MNLYKKIIICNSTDKINLTAKSHGLHNYKFMSEHEAVEGAFFKLEKKAVLFIHLKYHLPISISKEMLTYLYYIEDKEYNSLKLSRMKGIKKELEKRGLITIDEGKRRLLSSHDVVFYNKLESKKRKLVASKLNASFIHSPSNLSKYSIYYAQSIEAEFVFVFQQIIKLLNSGIGLNEISILNVSSNDYSILHKMSALFKISVAIPPKGNTNNTIWIHNFFMLLKSKSAMKDVLVEIEEYNKDLLYEKIIEIINEYDLMEVKPLDTVSLFRQLLSETQYDSIVFKEAISLNDFSANYSFFVNFNDGKAPSLHKDEGYLSSLELEELNLDSIDGYNQLLQEEALNQISSLKNLIITYHLQEDGIKSNPSPLLERMESQVSEAVYEYGLSKEMDKIWLATLVETYQKYGIPNESIKEYNLDFLKNRFDNSFKFQNKQLYNDFLSSKERMVLSYTTMKQYNSCPFSYYVEKILGVNDYEENLGATLGTFVHEILENFYNESFSIKEHALELIAKMKTAKEKFYANSMLYAIKEIMHFNVEHESKATLSMRLTEEKIEEKLNDSFVFVGIMDKVLYQVCGDEVYVAIIDYKTSMNDVLSLDNLEDGLNLQLPTYIYLLSLSETFKNKKMNIIGIYLQHVSNIKYENKEDMKSGFRLQGYSINNPSLIAKLDPDYIKSDYIRSLSYSNDKFGYYSKILSNQDFSNLKELVEMQIKKTCDNITACEFPLQPIKILDSKTNACLYCSYKDICYVKEENFIAIEKKPFREAK